MTTQSTFTDSSKVRYRTTLALTHAGWWTTALIVGLRSANAIPQPMGVLAVATLGIGVGANLALNRMRLAGTITAVFETGLKVATALQANLQATAVVIETDLDGVITQAEHAEAIHWARDALVGRPLDVLVPDRFLRIHHEAFAKFQAENGACTAGTTLSVPIVGQDGTEWPMRLSIAKLGGSFTGTMVPSGVTADTYEVSSS